MISNLLSFKSDSELESASSIETNIFPKNFNVFLLKEAIGKQFVFDDLLLNLFSILGDYRHQNSSLMFPKK